MNPAARVEYVRALLASRSYRYGNEEQLQAGLAYVLRDHAVEREWPLTGGRVDLYLPVLQVAVEVKVKGSAGDVRRQLERYAADATVAGLVLVTNRFRHRFGDELGGKPLATVHVGLRL